MSYVYLDVGMGPSWLVSLFATLYMTFSVTMVTLWMTLLVNEQTLLSMMDDFMHWPKPYLLLSTTRDEILS